MWDRQGGLLIILSGQQSNLFPRATRLLGRSQHFGGALTVAGGPPYAWPQIPASSELPGLFLAEVCSILVVEKHEMAERLQRQNTLALEALVENLENQVWKERCTCEMV